MRDAAIAAARRAFPFAVFAVGFGLYASTLAPGLVFGDPAEYTLIPHLWAILHPPGYAFMTLLVKVWQTLVPVGTLAYRTNLLAAAAGAAAGVMVFMAVRCLSPVSGQSAAPSPSPEISAQQRGNPLARAGGHGVQSGVPALAAALSLITASDFWQHAIHTNAHIVSAVLASTSIFVLLRWRSTHNERWLWVFGWVAGLSVTHHPLLAFGFPAYAVFVGWGRPRWKTWLALAVCGLIGLAPWLYFPIRASIQPPPPFGPHDLNTLDGFLNLVLARGLAGVNLFHFGPGEQWHRAIVFWSLIQLQYAWPAALLAGIGLIWLGRRDLRAAALLGLHILLNLAFTMNTVQDVMAYLLVPLVGIAICIGAGAMALGEWASKGIDRLSRRRLSAAQPQPPPASPPGLSWAGWLQITLLIFPLATLAWLYPRISLRHLRDADAYVDSVHAHFAGKGLGAVLLSDWEHATPWWYRGYVEGVQLDPDDLTVVYVNKSFVDAAWENVDKGPIYLIEYNPALVNTGFRLRAEGAFYRLEPPPAAAMPAISNPSALRFGPVELLGYDVLNTRVRAGDSVTLILYLRAPEATDRIIHPWARLGNWEHRFTTDSHLLSTDWQAGEVIAERWEVRTPLRAAPGPYELRLGFSDLTTGEDFDAAVDLGTVIVTAREQAWDEAEGLAANFGQRVGVDRVEAWTGAGVPAHVAPWAEPLVVKPGGPVELRIKWRALASPENSYTVFVHLLTADNQLIASQDYTPLGGAWPTMLWFPKWLPGQAALDPYTIRVPGDAPPGDYYIEIGLYGLRSVVRVTAFDAEGNLAGDRFVLGGITVAP